MNNINIVRGGTPYPTINNAEIFPKLKSGYRMEKPENCAEPLYVFLFLMIFFSK